MVVVISGFVNTGIPENSFNFSIYLNIFLEKMMREMHGKYGDPVQGCGSLAKVGQWEEGGKSKQEACTVLAMFYVTNEGVCTLGSLLFLMLF